MKKNPTKPINLNHKRILVQRADRLGDLVLALPAIEALKKAYPEAKIDLLCSSRNQQLVSDYPLLNERIIFDLHKKPSIFKKRALVKTIKEKHYDAYISLWPESFYEKLGKRCNIPLRIGPHLGPLSRLYLTDSVSLDWGDNLIHESDYNLQLLKPLGLKTNPIYKLYPPKNPYNIISTKPIVLFFCGSGKASCLIPEKAIFNCVTELLNSKAFHVAVTYGEAPKKSLFDTIDDENFTHIKEGLPFNELLSLINTADIYCGPDTGPTHVASFLNKKCVATYKSWDNLPSRWGPVSDNFEIIRYESHHDAEDAQKQWSHQLSELIHSVHQSKAALSAKERQTRHRKASMRCLWVCKSKDDYIKEKDQIEVLSKQGWIIFSHIKEKGYFGNIVELKNKIKKHDINTVIRDRHKGLFWLLNKVYPLQAKPRLTLLQKNSDFFG